MYENLTVTATFSLDIETTAKLSQLSQDTGKSKSEILRDLIKQEYDKHDKKPAAEFDGSGIA